MACDTAFEFSSPWDADRSFEFACCCNETYYDDYVPDTTFVVFTPTDDEGGIWRVVSGPAPPPPTPGDPYNPIITVAPFNPPEPTNPTPGPTITPSPFIPGGPVVPPGGSPSPGVVITPAPFPTPNPGPNPGAGDAGNRNGLPIGDINVE